ncbi:MAG: histidine phosphatase family protein [Rhodospirillales bacterium]
MIVRLSLICHASTAAVRVAAFPADEALDPQGEASLAALAATGSLPADQGWSVPELRARQTAAALGLSTTTDDRLGDCDYGRWRGSTLATVQAREPDAVRSWLADPAAAAPHGGESLLALLTRVGDWLGLLPSSAPPSTRIIAVTHPAVIRASVRPRRRSP